MTRPRRTLGYRLAQLAGWTIILGLFGLFTYGAARRGPSCLEFSPELIGVRVFEAPPCQQVNHDSLYEVTLETTLGPIEVVLDPAISPQAVNTFVFLARTGWYDGTVFHRIEETPEHAYAQAGAANPDGTGHAGFVEVAQSPSPILRYQTGLMAMVVSGEPAETSSHFFLIGEEWEAIGATEHGLPRYPPLGRIYDVASLGVLRRIIALGSEDGTPAQTVVIGRVLVEEITDNTTPSPAPTPSGSS